VSISDIKEYKEKRLYTFNMGEDEEIAQIENYTKLSDTSIEESREAEEEDPKDPAKQKESWMKRPNLEPVKKNTKRSRGYCCRGS
jgi:hypothetical protein